MPLVSTVLLNFGLLASSIDVRCGERISLRLPDDGVAWANALDRGAERGRAVDSAHGVKAQTAAIACRDALQRRYPEAQVQCVPSYPLGWSATVPLVAEVRLGNGAGEALLVKFCDNHVGILDQVADEAVWQQALTDAGHRVAPRTIYFDRAERMLVSERASGVPATKALFAQATYRHQVARALAAVHELPLDAVPGKPHLFVRRVVRSLQQTTGGHHVDAASSEEMERYAAALEGAIASRFVRQEDATPAHGDAKAGNMFFDAAGDKVTLLDFGMAHHGDPAEDIGFFFSSVHLAVDDVDDFVAAYAVARRAPVDARFVERVLLHVAYARFEHYVSALRWYDEEPKKRQALAYLVQQDFLRVVPYLDAFVSSSACR